jgi:BASS family bile acid:Na+ symporter
MLNAPRHALAFVGRHATIAYAFSIVLGLGLPQLAAGLRPFIPISIFVFIMLAFARANLPGLRVVFSQPARLGRALAISALVPPIIGWLFLNSPFAAGIDPALRLGIAPGGGPAFVAGQRLGNHAEP